MNVMTSILLTLLLVACLGGGSPSLPTPAPVISPKPDHEILPFDLTNIRAPRELKENRILTFSWSGMTLGNTFTVCKKNTAISSQCDLIGVAKEQSSLEVEMEGSLFSLIDDDFFIAAKNQHGSHQKSKSRHINTSSINALIQYIKASKTNHSDAFGWSIALSADGKTLAIGANRDNSGSTGVNEVENSHHKAMDSGAVHVFYYGPSGWRKEAFIKASNTDKNDLFGYAVSLNADGTTLAVGALNEAASATALHQSDNSAFGAGAVYIFEQDNFAGWEQKARIKANNAAAGDNFGHAVSLSANAKKLAIGANKKTTTPDGNNLNKVVQSGASYVFKQDAEGWKQEAYITAINTGKQDYFGSALSISHDGNTLAIGASHEDNNGAALDYPNIDKVHNSGASYIFKFAQNAWTQKFYLKASNMDPNDNFGFSLSLSGDGKTLAVGAPFESSSSTQINGDQQDNSKPGTGAVYLFEEKANSWDQTVYLKARNADNYDVFGMALALNNNGRTLAVSAIYEDAKVTGLNGDEQDNSAENSGAVYVFKKETNTWKPTSFVKASNTGAFDLFGSSLALSGNAQTLAVGSPGESSNATDINGDETNNDASKSGAVYVY